jgi:hypothetical protein
MKKTATLQNDRGETFPAPVTHAPCEYCDYDALCFHLEREGINVCAPCARTFLDTVEISFPRVGGDNS